MTNAPINLTAAHLTFIEALRVLLFDANALPAMAIQSGAFGDIATALRTAIAHAVEADTDINFGACTEIAWAVYSAMLDSGEDAAYCIRLLNDGVIDRDFRI